MEKMTQGRKEKRKIFLWYGEKVLEGELSWWESEKWN